MNRLLNALFITLAIALTGCAANVQRGADEGKLALSPAATKRIAMDVQGNETMTASRDWEQFRGVWRTEMAEAAKLQGVAVVPLEAARAPDAAPATLVTVKVNDYRYITRAARVVAGITTGNAYVDSDVTFTELPAGTLIGKRKYATSSSTMQGVFAPMTERQLQGITEEIVREISQR